MAIFRKVSPLTSTEVSENRTRVIASTNQLARDGHIVEPAGLKTDNFLRTGSILFDHDPKTPVASPVSATINAEGFLEVEVEWPPFGTCAESDRIRGLVKSGVIRAASIGFEPLESEPLNPSRPRGGQHITSAELLELSFVAVPADTGAAVTQRAGSDQITAAIRAAIHSKETTDMSKALKANHARALERAPKVPVFKRGLYEVASLAYLLSQLGYARESAEYEAALEGDDSPVPGMVGEALIKLGDALKAMTAEEVDELLAAASDGDEDEDEDEEDDLPDEERSFIAAGATPRARAWRRGIALARVRSLSASNEKKLEEAQGHHARAMKHTRSLGEHQEAVTRHADEIGEANSKAVKAHGDLGEALQDAKSDPENADKHVTRAIKAHKVVAAQHEEVGAAQTNLADRNADVGDSRHAAARCVQAAQRCVRGVVEGSNPTDDAEDGDEKDIQTSAGTEEAGGSKNGRSRESRTRDLADLEAVGRSYG